MPVQTMVKGRRVQRPEGTGPRAANVEQVPVQKLRRRPGVLVGSVVAVLVGASGAAWAWTVSANAADVVAVRANVQRGEVIDRADLLVVRVGVDPALKTIPATDLETLVGRRAATDLAAGALLTPGQTTTTAAPGQGLSIVGVGLPEGSMPSEPLMNGDLVRVVDTPGAQGVGTVEDPPSVVGNVVGVRISENKQLTVVDVLVPADKAGRLAARAATGNVALVLDTRER